MVLYCLHSDTGVKVESKSGIDAMRPTTVAEFTEFATALTNKITEYEVSVPVYLSSSPETSSVS